MTSPRFALFIVEHLVFYIVAYTHTQLRYPVCLVYFVGHGACWLSTGSMSFAISFLGSGCVQLYFGSRQIRCTLHQDKPLR